MPHKNIPKRQKLKPPHFVVKIFRNWSWHSCLWWGREMTPYQCHWFWEVQSGAGACLHVYLVFYILCSYSSDMNPNLGRDYISVNRVRGGSKRCLFYMIFNLPRTVIPLWFQRENKPDSKLYYNGLTSIQGNGIQAFRDNSSESWNVSVWDDCCHLWWLFLHWDAFCFYRGPSVSGGSMQSK